MPPFPPLLLYPCKIKTLFPQRTPRKGNAGFSVLGVKDLRLLFLSAQGPLLGVSLVLKTETIGFLWASGSFCPANPDILLRNAWVIYLFIF